MIPAALGAVVLVRLGAGTCAGALVAPDRVLTAWHCVAAAGRPSVEWRDGARAVGRVVGADRARDLALVAIAATDRPVLPVASAPPAIGTPVTALGHPLGADLPGGFFAGTLRWSATPGAVSGVGERAVQLAVPVTHGDSGGPVVDADGTVVGVVSRRLSGGPAFAGRVDGVPAELEAPGWRRGPGVALSAAVVGLTQPVADGLLGAGGRIEVAVADRVWIAGAGFAPWAPLATAARWGEATSAVGEAALGLRLGVGRGPWAAAIDGFAAATAVQTWTANGDSALAPHATFGGRIGARRVGLELASTPGAGLSRAAITVRWPGTVAVF